VKVHNQISRSAELTAAVTAALGITKVEGGVERFSETVDLVMNLWGMPEWAFLRTERLCARSLFQTAVAAEFSMIALLNPVGSGHLAVVEAAHSSQVNSKFQCCTEAELATLAGRTQVAHARDRRWGRGALSAAGAFNSTCVVANGTDPTEALNASGIFFETISVLGQPAACVPVVLNPGHAFVISGSTVNTSLFGNLVWRERRAYPSELF
jgi:hypothetical protein